MPLEPRYPHKTVLKKALPYVPTPACTALPYRGTSLIRNRPPPGPCSSSRGGGRFLMSKVPRRASTHWRLAPEAGPSAPRRAYPPLPVLACPRQREAPHACPCPQISPETGRSVPRRARLGTGRSVPRRARLSRGGPVRCEAGPERSRRPFCPEAGPCGPRAGLLRGMIFFFGDEIHYIKEIMLVIVVW